MSDTRRAVPTVDDRPRITPRKRRLPRRVTAEPCGICSRTAKSCICPDGPDLG